MPEPNTAFEAFALAAVFVLGAVTGSFANVCISRWPQGQSVVSPRSRCPKCLNAIAWYDNIPILSWIFLGAKCRHCREPISVQYPLVEALTGVLFMLTYWRFGFTVATPVYLALAAALVIVTFQDLADWTIPDEITLPGIPLGFLVSVVGMLYGEQSHLRVLHPFDALAGTLLGGGILLILDRVTVLLLKKPGMGMGDVKLLGMLGTFIGWKGVLGTLMIASVLGSIIGLILIGLAKRRHSKSPASESASADGEVSTNEEEPQEEAEQEITLEGHYLPFGPYLALGALIYLFIGPEVLAWYQNYLNPTEPGLIIVR